MIKPLFVVALLCLLFTLGCAVVTRHANIVYPPHSLEDSGKVTSITAAGSQGEIVLQPFTDDRADKHVVGHVRNGFGMKMAEIVGPDDLSGLVTDAVRKELTRAGYQVLEAGGTTNQMVPMISGAVMEVHCDAYISLGGLFLLDVHLSRDGHEIYRKTFQGKGSVGLIVDPTDRDYGRSLSLALQDALESLKQGLPVALKQ